MGVSGQRHAPTALYPREMTLVSIGQEVGWAPEPVRTQRLEEKSFAPAGDRISIARSSRHYTDWATPAPYLGVNPSQIEVKACVDTIKNLKFAWNWHVFVYNQMLHVIWAQNIIKKDTYIHQIIQVESKRF
jgi:hypothetical protein